MSKFSMRLKELRQEKDMSLDEVALAIGVSKSTLSKYETEQREPKLTFAKKISDYFGVDFDWLVGQSDIRNERKKITILNGDEQDVRYIRIAMDAKNAGITPEKLAALVEFLKQQ